MDEVVSKIIMKSKRNKTIDFPLDYAKEFFEKCQKADQYDGKAVNTVINSDCFFALDKLDNKSIDLLIVDPPYNLDKNFNGSLFKKTDGKTYTDFTRKWVELVKPKLKDTASLYVCSDWYSSIFLAPILDECFILRNRITWGREKGRGAKANWKNSMEDIFFATVGDDYYFNLDAVKQQRYVVAPYKENGKPKDWTKTDKGNYRLTCPSNFWDDITIPFWSMPENTAHPTQKPEKLIAKMILASSVEGDTVLDIFAGSGTTGVVAKKLNRNYIMIEKDPLYCAWAEYRLLNADKDKTIQGYEDGVFYARNYKK